MCVHAPRALQAPTGDAEAAAKQVAAASLGLAVLAAAARVAAQGDPALACLPDDLVQKLPLFLKVPSGALPRSMLRAVALQQAGEPRCGGGGGGAAEPATLLGCRWYELAAWPPPSRPRRRATRKRRMPVPTLLKMP